jgi:hypothetical protein
MWGIGALSDEWEIAQNFGADLTNIWARDIMDKYWLFLWIF